MNNDNFVALQCPNCGGNLSVTKEKIEELFIESASGDFVYIGSGTGEETIQCDNCKVKFERRQRTSIARCGSSSAFNQSGQTVNGSQINIATNGGAVIGGSINIGGNFYGRDATTKKGEDFVGRHVYVNGKRVK